MSDENSRFRELVKKYRKHYSLSQANVASLYGAKQSDYTGIESGRRTIDLNLANKISGIYGLTYCEMIEHKREIPSLDKLPTETRKLVTQRVAKGVSGRDYNKNVAGNLDKLIHETTLLNSPVTADEIRLNFPKEIRDDVKTIRITDLLKKSGRDQLVAIVGKKNNSNLYQLRNFIKK